MAKGSNSEIKIEASFPFPSTHLPYALQPPSFFQKAFGAPHESPSWPPRRGSGDQLETGSADAVRPGAGRRSSPPPSLATTLEAVAPDLLEKTSSVDLAAPLPTPDSVEKYRTVRKASTTAHILNLLSRNPAPPRAGNPVPIQLIPEALSQAKPHPVTSNTDISQHSQSSGSTAMSKVSAASSFAYHLQHGLPDLRLFKEKSKPAQHTIQKPSILKLPGDVKRSPTFFKPKVVSDTAIVITGKFSAPPTALPAPVTHALPEMLRDDPIVKRPVSSMPIRAPPITRKPLPALALWDSPRKAQTDPGKLEEPRLPNDDQGDA